jgi:hypothetical protein
MKHFNNILPGEILTVHYENLVEETELYVKRLLDYCGLEFEPSCLEFYKNKRAICTPSSEQVKQPIYNTAVDHWQNYERYLEPLKNELRDIVDSYDIDRKSFF